MRKYGWIPDLPDHRDKFYKLSKPPEKLPPLVDLRLNCGPVYDQGQIGSCTSNALASAILFDEIITSKRITLFPSRLFIYYQERVIEGSTDQDAGAMLRDGVKSLTQGYCSEYRWPYDTNNVLVNPNSDAYSQSVRNKVTSYLRVNQDAAHMKGCLEEGFPFVAGFSVYDSFESDQVASSGIVPLPLQSESLIGGHAVLVCGYNDSSARFICKNSWGISWGMKGYFTIPYAYFLNPNLASDFWTLRKL